MFKSYQNITFNTRLQRMAKKLLTEALYGGPVFRLKPLMGQAFIHQVLATDLPKQIGHQIIQTHLSKKKKILPSGISWLSLTG